MNWCEGKIFSNSLSFSLLAFTLLLSLEPRASCVLTYNPTPPRPYQKCISHTTLDSMEPWSSLMAPAHLAGGKFISHKQTGAKRDRQKLSSAWHCQLQQCASNVLGRVYIDYTQKEVAWEGSTFHKCTLF